MAKVTQYINPDFQFYLRKDASNYYIVNPDGTVTTTTEKTPLEESVMNWNEVKFGWVRHERYHGIFRKQSTAIRFAKTGATILRHKYNLEGGMMAKCELLVEILDKYTQKYTTQFINDIDFSTYNSKLYWVECGTMEAGLSELINAYENTEFKIPIDPADCIKVNMDGIIIKSSYRYVTSAYTDSINSLYNDLGVSFARQEGDLSSGVGISVTPSGAGRYWMFVTNYDTVVNVKLNFRIDYTISQVTSATDSISIMYEVYNDVGLTSLYSSGTIYAAPLVVVSGGPVTTSAFAVITRRFALPANKYLRLFVERTVNKSLVGLTYTINDGNVIIDTETNSAQSADRVENTRIGYRMHQVLDKLITKISDGRYTTAPGFLHSRTALPKNNYDAVPYDEVILSEQSLKLLKDNPVIKIKLADLLQDCMSEGIGFGIKNNQFVNGLLVDFYSPTVAGEIKYMDEPEISTDPDAVFNNMEIGYEGGDSIDDINRLNAYNTKQFRKAPISRLLDKNNQTWNMVSPIYAEPQYIELVRLKNKENKVTINNTRKDDVNRNFKVHINRTPVAGIYDLWRGGTITGIDFPAQTYNAALTPTRKFLRNAPLVKSKLYGLPSQLMTYLTDEQDVNMVSYLSADVGYIIEMADYNMAAHPAALLYKPRLIKIKGTAPDNMFAIMQANPEQTWKIVMNDIVLYGFVMQAFVNQANPQPFEFIFRMSPVVSDDKLVY